MSRRCRRTTGLVPANGIMNHTNWALLRVNVQNSWRALWWLQHGEADLLDLVEILLSMATYLYRGLGAGLLLDLRRTSRKCSCSSGLRAPPLPLSTALSPWLGRGYGRRSAGRGTNRGGTRSRRIPSISSPRRRHPLLPPPPATSLLPLSSAARLPPQHTPPLTRVRWHQGLPRAVPPLL